MISIDFGAYSDGFFMISMEFGTNSFENKKIPMDFATKSIDLIVSARIFAKQHFANVRVAFLLVGTFALQVFGPGRRGASGSDFANLGFAIFPCGIVVKPLLSYLIA